MDIRDVTLVMHILGGGLALASGFVALFAAKGARLHRRGGIVFVCSMVLMGLSGAGIAAFQRVEGSVIAGVLATYLVVTALTTVRPPTPASRRLELGLMLVALATGLACVALAIETLAAGEGQRDGVPVPMLFVFGAVGLGSGLSDARVMRAGGIRGAPRLARHLWRMCFALFIASGSFFLGQADEIPEPLRLFPLLAVPAFLPLLVIPYWLWRVRGRQAFRGRAGAGAPDARRAVPRARSPVQAA